MTRPARYRVRHPYHGWITITPLSDIPSVLEGVWEIVVRLGYEVEVLS